MIKKTFVTGDTHGNVKRRLSVLKYSGEVSEYQPEEVAVIILGDVGLNYWLNDTDNKNKEEVSSFGYYIYCVRGNHEERPEELESMEVLHDNFVNGVVYYEPTFPLIRYFVDGADYNIKGLNTIVIGGSYSVDKFWRLETGNKWFQKEQLSEEERVKIENKLKDNSYDLILAHTCPYSWMPTDLFLTCIDQTKVDKTMECWLECCKEDFSDAIYLFGHYHADRLVRPKVQMFYHSIEDLDIIIDRWNSTKELDAYFEKDPKYYWGR